MGRQFVSGATTDIILTLARLTATTGLTGLRVECLSVPARGMAGDALGVGAAGAGGAAGDAALDAILIGMTEGSAVAVSPATGALTAAVLTVAVLTTVRRASAVTGSAATADFMVEVVGSAGVAASMVAAASTVVEDSTAAAAEGSTVVVDAGNCKPIRNSHVR
jgi:hypothetical protein